MIEFGLMHEGLDSGEHVGLLLAIINGRQHGKPLVAFQRILEDRYGDIAEHAVEHIEVADAAYALGSKATDPGGEGRQDRINIVMDEGLALLENGWTIEDAKGSKLLSQTPFHAVCPEA